MGNFIYEMRKSHNWTQKELAQRLNITDKTMSKWERGISYPDISLLIPLAKEFGITTSELLNGEKITGDIKESEQLVKETLLYSDRNTSQKIRTLKTWFLASLIFSAITTASVCMICDYCITGRLTWSLLVNLCLLFGTLLLLPLLTVKRNVAKKFLTVASFTIFPYLLVLSKLLKTPSVFTLGAIIAVISVAAVWCIYLVFHLRKNQRLFSVGITFLIVILVMWGINLAIAEFIHEPVAPLTLFIGITVTVLFTVLSLICFVMEHNRLQKKSLLYKRTVGKIRNHHEFC